MHLLRRHSKEARRAATKPGHSDGRCRRHPKHRQSPGICSLCLRERLMHLDAPTCTTAPRAPDSSAESSSASSSISSYSSSLGSSCSSPQRDRSSKVSVSSLLFGGHKVSALMKSRSLAFAPRSTRSQQARAVDDVTKENHEAYRERNTGFWSKLLHNHKRTDHQAHRFSLGMHSKTVRERSSVTIEL